MKKTLLAAACVVSCASARDPGAKQTSWLVVETRPADALDVTGARVSGHGVRSATARGPELVLEVDPRKVTDDIVVELSGACPVRFGADDARHPGTVRRRAEPFIDVGGDRPEIGYGTEFTITARPGCPEARAGSVAWRSNGAPLTDVRTTDRGFVFTARTERFELATSGAAPRWGIVPLSPRTRAETHLVATWRDDQGHAVERHLDVSAAARARGLPNVALGTRLYLGGDGWHVASTPPGGHATVETRGGLASISPDARGVWGLEDAARRTLRLVAGKYDETPLDCGRGECHAAIASIADSSPMTSILERGLDAPFGADYPGCAVGCHTVGEPGADDGGFVPTAFAFGRSLTSLAHEGFHDMPPALRRLGGVGCLACHGPGAIPEASARYAILSTDVCATCHDAPPRYGHVAAFRTSRMADADRDPRTRAMPCARCHTTWGFLDAPARRPPDVLGSLGIGCAACHAVHPAEGDGVTAGKTCDRALVRDVPAPELVAKDVPEAAERSRICLSCHTPSPDDAWPRATAAALWSGRGGLNPEDGAPLAGPAPHGSVPGGCIGCHEHATADVTRGAGHGFRASRNDCRSCHEKPPAAADPVSRARALWADVEQRIAHGAARGGGEAALDGPPHARGLSVDRSTPFGRAAWDVALVLEDPAADAHNAAYANALLDAAARVLAPRATASVPPPRGASR